MSTAELFVMAIDVDRAHGLTTRQLYQHFGDGLTLLVAWRTVENYWDPDIPRVVLASTDDRLDTSPVSRTREHHGPAEE